ncbi:MAG: hypothetical protein Q7S07_05975 [Candidatus Omnitrophota bacterium]|nr:hypothetical protein [Candidatus Omnitrophota bacterium]
MQRASYELDPFNRLITGGGDANSSLKKFRKVLDGQFKVDGDNNLSYHIKAPLSGGENIPNQIRLIGDWSVTEDHKLRLTLVKAARETFGDEVILQGRIIDVDKNSLLFSMTTKSGNGKDSTYILNLRGSWKADEFNRLSFWVKRESGAHDILTFNGVWEVGRANQIIYHYDRASLIRKKREVHTLIFTGHWDIREKLRISYVLDANSSSAFDFKSSVGILKEDRIRYEVSIGLENNPEPARRTITLGGEWIFRKDAGIFFEIGYEGGSSGSISFGADVKIADKEIVSFRLKSGASGEDLGMTLELSRKLLIGDGEIFLNALASRNELACYAGAAWRW